ncbi:hypothetical protein C8A01DRAFT_40465 [Parachaetomium inaequale]|uniref:Aminoglycoside phosphotransferase domain-containing protein n=1 Tax=Parachaetomium inaequale TaxID=2588326 RepID=A0AAN6P7B3_9PEZI|nr:hypothetical protein C8A01DRAFT_40465 [Parachaetomium inaequale]
MATTYSEYSVDAEIEAFFKKTSATRDECHARAKEVAGDNVVPVQVQGVCSYSVYAGPELEYVVQFRLESLALKPEVTSRVSFEGLVGDAEKEPLYVYFMSRVRGITHLDFILENGFPEDTPDNLRWRKNLMTDVAHFMALPWKGPQPVTPEYRNNLRQTYLRDLQLLRTALPARFQPIVQTCIDSIDDIMSLPMVLLHRDFGSCNIMVDETTYHLVGVIDWAEAELHLRNGWTRYVDYDALQEVFWGTFREEAGLSDQQVATIKLARALGLLLSSGFTCRLANEPEPTPIGDDEQGRYNMLSLDGFLINPETNFDGLE